MLLFALLFVEDVLFFPIVSIHRANKTEIAVVMMNSFDKRSYRCELPQLTLEMV